MEVLIKILSIKIDDANTENSLPLDIATWEMGDVYSGRWILFTPWLKILEMRFVLMKIAL